MNDAVWWWATGIAVVAVIAVAVGVALARSRSRRRTGCDDPPRSEAPVVVADTSSPTPGAAPVVARPLAPPPPPPPRAAAPVSPPARAKAHDPVPVTVVPTSARPSAPVVERVLAVTPADELSWSAATPLAMSPVQAAAVAMLVAPVAADHERLRVRFAAAAAMRLARADAGAAQALATSGALAVPPPLQWLDSAAASSLASNLLAAIATAGDLGTLADEGRDLKAAVAALPSKPFGAAELRLKPLLQDASRYAREARDNYPSVIGKVAFRERIGSAFTAALAVWRDQLARAEPLHARAEPLLRAPRFGEVQVEAALALWREIGEWQRLLELSARLLAMLHLLRVSVGDGPAPGEGHAIASAATSLRAIADENGDAATRLGPREADARGDPYVGRGEFEANRAALRKLLERPWRDGVERAVVRVEQAARVAPPELAGAVLIALAGGSCEVRLAPG